jgi:protein TonB
MSEPVIFKELPETFPKRDRYQKPSVISSVIFHVALITMLVVIPLLLPQSISQRELLIALVEPLGPPPAAAPPLPPPALAPAVRPKAVKPQLQPPAPEALIMPVAIPSEVARIVEEPIASDSGVIGGVPGLPGRTTGSVLGGILSANTIAIPPPAVAPPPPPPPPPPPQAAPAEPLRVGGVVKEPRIVKLVPPVYPKMASLARVSGTVVLEAVVTVDGTVAEIRIISGHPLLADAAIAAVKQWQYEPTLLNGVPTAVILTATVHFERAIT